MYSLLLEALRPSILVVTGPAGSGKTFEACKSARKLLESRVYKKVILTRPAVSPGESIGFLPGTLEKKMGPWLSQQDQYLKKAYQIEPLAYMRGKNYENSFIIADEMQNSTPTQMKMVLTRISTGSKLIIIGDPDQSDIYQNNGLADLLYKIKNSKSALEHIRHIQLTETRRHESTREILDLYER